MKFVFALVLSLFASLANAQAIWAFQFQDDNGGDPYMDSFSATGTFTTATNDLSVAQPMLSIQGSFTDDYVYDATKTLVPLGQTVVTPPTDPTGGGGGSGSIPDPSNLLLMMFGVLALLTARIALKSLH